MFRRLPFFWLVIGSHLHCALLGMGRPLASSKGATSTVADRLRTLEARVESLDGAVQELHPDYSARVVARVTEIEETCRTHANSVLQVLTNQRLGVESAATKAAGMANDACARLERSSTRHEEQAAALRTEIGVIKDMVDARSADCERDLANMKIYVQDVLDHMERQETLSRQVDAQIEKLSRLEALAKQVQDTARNWQNKTRSLQCGSSASIAGARGRTQSEPPQRSVLKMAQKLAESRSPSSRLEACRQNAKKLTRQAHPLWIPPGGVLQRDTQTQPHESPAACAN